MVEESEKKWFSMLPVGRAIVKLQDRWRRPFLVQMPLVPVRKGLVSDNLLGRFVSGSLTARGLKQAVDRQFGRMPHSLTDAPLSQDALKFLQDVLAHQDDSLRARYKRLRLSVDKGTSLKSHLVENGVLEEQDVKVGRTRKVLLRVTPAVRAKLGLDKHAGRGSIAHEYWKRFYAAFSARMAIR